MIYLRKIPAILSKKYLSFCFSETNQAPLLKLILRKQSKFLVIRLAARIMSLFVYIFLYYRENNEVAGHTAASGREPIEQGVGRYLQAQEVPVSILIENIKTSQN